jgi:hypothetical protein
MKIKLCAYVIAILLLLNLNCSNNKVEPFTCNGNTKESESLKLYEHPNGLLICFPSYLKHTGKITFTQTDLGFTIATEFPGRYPTTITVELRKNQEPPKGDWPEQTYINKQLVHYRIDELGGGSGGTEYELTAWQQFSDSYLVLKLQTQHEFNPDFSLGFKLLASTKLKVTQISK